jgi:hypothetical protein
MKTLEQVLIILMVSSAAIFGCSKDETTTPVTPTAGTADITLTAGGQQFKVKGPCGWASAGGTNYIGANQESNNLRTFSAFFNIKTPPSTTTTYVLVDDALDTDPTHIAMSISELSGSKLTEWSSGDTSGKLTLVVSGNKITANLSGITLQPTTNAGFYTSGNVGDFANPGVLTGTLTFYK